ncbi:LacI family DNA-binding transcriptional regulator [Pseudocolwellia sp. AS88]|uniref:LacI family DNA-binding transcriptional regulator n=1 Tax=Pseudocolwellia sp. AS88 TaxID=3063958 RepID=UPI0026EAB9FC|nr:LacI family DNA-binding transcriptional regulator [Pseudocolwellia sp. AS88]MDO7083491.1 LacI family DNA-binding transcriptional regulator [Pseudocolwellia sp. AS88]
MKASRRARIKDVAEHAGVSSMTVSRVLNKDPKVSDAKRALVAESVKALNYRPNVSARRLASNKSFFIGLLYFDLDTSYVSKFLLRGLKVCRTTGHHLVVDEIDDDIEKSLASVRELIEETRVDGLILLPHVCDDVKLLAALQEANITFVRIAPDTQLSLSPYICMDDYQASFEMTELLIKKGHTKIGHIIGNPNQGVSRLRYQGYLDALRSHQINTPPEYIEQGLFTYDSGLIAAKKLLALADRPTAIVAANDEMAASVLAAANLARINVPEELSISGFDDGNVAVTVSPNLTTVRQPIHEMAELAIDIIASGKFSDLAKANTREFRNVLDFEIIERDSTAQAPQK